LGGKNHQQTKTFWRAMLMTPFQIMLRSSKPIPLPTDQRLTIEWVSMFCEGRDTAIGGTFVALMTQVGESVLSHMFFPKFVQVNDVGLNIYGATEVVRIYAGAGTTLRLDFMQSKFNYFVTVSGFLSPVYT
jgi:hypothetical protein